MGRTQTVAPAETPVTSTIAKDHLNLSGSAFDNAVTRAIAGATADVESFTNRQLVTATWRQTFTGFYPACRAAGNTGQFFELTKPPLQSVSSITYYDTDGVSQTLSSSKYTVVTDGPVGAVWLAYGQSWPSVRAVPNAVTVTFIAGYGLPSTGLPAAVPSAIVSALLLQVGNLFRFREDVIVGTINSTLDINVQRLLYPYRVRMFAGYDGEAGGPTSGGAGAVVPVATIGS